MTTHYQPSFVEKLQFRKTDTVMLYTAKNGWDMPFFCYIRCKLDGYRQMQDDYRNGIAAAPETYGEVLYRAYLPKPDEAAEAFLASWLAEHGA